MSGDQLLNGLATDDLLHRHAFLKDAITTHNDDHPDKQWLLPSRFQGEWAVTSCSMYSMALCNLGFLYPNMRSDLLNELQCLIDRVSQRSYRQFDIDAWNEDPLDSLKSDNGHVWVSCTLKLDDHLLSVTWW